MANETSPAVKAAELFDRLTQEWRGTIGSLALLEEDDPSQKPWVLFIVPIDQYRAWRRTRGGTPVPRIVLEERFATEQQVDEVQHELQAIGVPWLTIGMQSTMFLCTVRGRPFPTLRWGS